MDRPPVISWQSTPFADALEKAMSAYSTRCWGADEVHPATGECINSFGFAASLLESLETLFLAGKWKLYKRARNYVAREFDCRNIERVNRREFWTRGIASLIGAYLVTRDPLFLGQAEKCARIVLEFKNAPALVDLKSGVGQGRGWEHGARRADLSTGLPELVALTRLTKSSELENHLRKQIKRLKKMSMGVQWDADSVAFVSDVATAYGISGDSEIGMVLKDVEVKALVGENASLLYPLVSAVDLVDNRVPGFFVWNMESLVAHGEKEYSRKRPFSGLQHTKLIWTHQFDFDATLLLTWLRQGKNLEVIDRILSWTLSNCTCGRGYCGLTVSNGGKVYRDDVQHSNFVGQWIKAGVLLHERRSRVKDYVFNSRGHVIWIHSSKRES